MNQPRFFFAILLLTITTGCKQGFEKIADSEINVAQRDAAGAFATRVLSSHREGKFEVPSENEVTLEFRKVFGVEKQKASHESIKGLWGDFISIEYVEAVKPKDGTLLKIYRFKGRFKGTSAEPEVRVVFDGQGKISGFWLKPWQNAVK